MLVGMRPELIGYLADSYINGITSKKIHVLSSHHPEYALSENLVSNALTMAREDSDFSRVAILAHDGDLYSLMINASYTCVKNGILLSKCSEPTLFGLSESKYGYKLTHYDKCLTITSRIAFKECKEDNRNQDLAFEDKSMFYCKEDQVPLEKEAEPGQKKPDKKKVPEDVVDKKLEKALEKHGIKDKDMKKALKKMWKWKGWWPKLGLCTI